MTIIFWIMIIKGSGVGYYITVQSGVRLYVEDLNPKGKNHSLFTNITEECPRIYAWGVSEAASWSTIAIIKTLRDEKLYKDLRKIQVPTLIVDGVHDRVIPFSQAYEHSKQIKNSQFVPFHNSGHGLFWEERDKFNELLRKFIGLS